MHPAVGMGAKGVEEMAELLLKIGTDAPDPAYQDGDILFAPNERRMLCCHAEHICHPKLAARTRDGLRDNNSLARTMLDTVCQYRFERLSHYEVERVNLVTGERELFSDKPNERGEQIAVPEFVARRLKYDAHRIFGVPGREVWHGGTVDWSLPKVSAVWDAIEVRSALRMANHRHWPFTRQERLSFLPVKTDDFTDAVAETLVASEVDETDPENPVLVRKRRHRVDWEALLGSLGLSREDVRDRSRETDGRGVVLTRAAVVTQKARVR